MKAMRPDVMAMALAVLACAAGTYFPVLRAAAPPPDEQLIRDARARSNQAIAAHDVAAIARVWMEDVHVVSSTSSQTAGRTLNQQRMARQFAGRPDTVYVRRPTAIDVYASWDVASERGEWTGRWTEPDGVLQIGGTYLAQWRKVDGQWLIQAELFVPTRCRGAGYCRQRPS
jgi:ketosteroid isomerase-like protein